MTRSRNELGAAGRHAGGGGVFDGTVHDYELQNTIMRTSGEENLAHAKGEAFSTATSFYKHGSGDDSGSEEMILGGSPGPAMPPIAMTAEGGRDRGIVMTTEVRVTVK